MKIPTFIKRKFVDESGELTAPAQQFLDVFFQQAQENLSDDGLVVPQRNTQEINTISNPANQNSKPNGTLWYDTNTNQLKVRINDTVRIVTTS